MSDLSLHVMINKQKSKLLFAEANSDFIDVLLSFLTLPLGKLVTILHNHHGKEEDAHAPTIGSLNTLYTGLFNLDPTLFTVRGAKQMLLNPANSSRVECRKLKVDVADTPPNTYFICQNLHCLKYGFVNITMYSDVAVCECGKPLNREVCVERFSAGDADGGVFAVNSLSFVITDDLRVAPIVTGIVQTLSILGVADTQGAELRSVSFGKNEIMELLKLSLTSATPLSDLIIKKSEKSTTSTTSKPELGILLQHHSTVKKEANTRKMVLKVCLQKSTNKFLFAEAADEFLHFLLSLLTIPLGAVEFLLGGNTCLKNIDNLYVSVKDFFDDKYFTTPETKNRLINPKLAHGYLKPNQFLPLDEDPPPKLYYNARWTGKRYNISSFYERETEDDDEDDDDDDAMVSHFKLSKENFVKKQTTCFVMDDLTVTPSLTRSISILNDLGIPLSDVNEMELQVGLEEALRILNASLTSKTPLTDALIKPMLNKLPKLEHQPKQER